MLRWRRVGGGSSPIKVGRKKETTGGKNREAPCWCVFVPLRGVLACLVGTRGHAGSPVRIRVVSFAHRYLGTWQGRGIGGRGGRGGSKGKYCDPPNHHLASKQGCLKPPKRRTISSRTVEVALGVTEVSGLAFPQPQASCRGGYKQPMKNVVI